MWLRRKVRAARPSKVWSPAPGWPLPPPGWAPPPGWSPDPSWPPAPIGQVFWVRTSRGQRRRRGGYAALTVLLLLFGGCTVQSFRDPCFFDPVPGDQFTRTISNDSAVNVLLVSCDDESCRTGYNEVPVGPGRTADVIVEACSIETYAVADPATHGVLGCLHEDGDSLGTPPSASDRRVTERRACGKAHGTYKIHIFDPAG